MDTRSNEHRLFEALLLYLLPTFKTAAAVPEPPKAAADPRSEGAEHLRKMLQHQAATKLKAAD